MSAQLLPLVGGGLVTERGHRGFWNVRNIPVQDLGAGDMSVSTLWNLTESDPRIWVLSWTVLYFNKNL